MVDDLGSRRELEYVRTILAEGTSAEKQLEVYRETGDLRAVVQSLVDETRAEVEQSATTLSRVATGTATEELSYEGRTAVRA